MARKKASATTTTTKKPQGKREGGDKTKINTKTSKNIFKLSSEKSKTRKPKQVQGKLKKMKQLVMNKCEKANASMKELHEQMVIAKPKAVLSSVPLVKKSTANTRAANAKDMSQDLDNLKF